MGAWGIKALERDEGLDVLDILKNEYVPEHPVMDLGEMIELMKEEVMLGADFSQIDFLFDNTAMALAELYFQWKDNGKLDYDHEEAIWDKVTGFTASKEALAFLLRQLTDIKNEVPDEDGIREIVDLWKNEDSGEIAPAWLEHLNQLIDRLDSEQEARQMYIKKYWGNFIGGSDDSLNLVAFLEDQKKEEIPLSEIFAKIGLDKQNWDFRQTVEYLEFTHSDGVEMDFHFAIDVVTDLAAILLECSVSGSVNLQDLDEYNTPARRIRITATPEEHEAMDKALADFVHAPLEYDISEMMGEDEITDMASQVEMLRKELYEASGRNRNYHVKAEDVKDLLPDWEGADGCIATNRITVEGCKVPLDTLREEEGTDKIFDFRDKLEEVFTTGDGPEILTLTGGATGLYCGYVDFIAWDIQEALNMAKEFFEGTDIPWAIFHTFRREAGSISLKQQDDGTETENQDDELDETLTGMDYIPYTQQNAESFFQQLEQWNDEDEYTRCIQALNAIPENWRNYRTAYALARALENYAIIGDHDEGTLKSKGDKALLRAIEVLESVREEGQDKAEWNMRMAYGYQYLYGQEEKAIPYAQRWAELDPEDENAPAVIRECKAEIRKRQRSRKKKAKFVPGDTPFEGFDLTNFWDDNWYALKEYVSDPPSDELIASVEEELGYKLPAAYIWLMKQHNGGIPVNTCYPCDEPTCWSDDHVAITGIFGIGREKSCSLCGELGSQFMIDEWEYPAIGVAICDCPSAGHDMIFLDYRVCGPQGEPAVVHVDQENDYKITHLADSFEEFVRGLEHESLYDPDEDAEDLEDDADEEKTDRKGSFVGSVLLSKAEWDKEQLIRNLREEWGIVDEEPDEGDEDDENSDDAVVMWVGGMMLIVTLFHGHIPDNEAEINAENNYMWPEAVEVAKAHKAHIMVAVLGEEEKLLERGKLFTKAMAVCCKQKYATGVYTSGVVFEPRFYEGLADMLKEDELPIFNWVWFGLYRSEGGLNGYTYGMDVFGKEEMEVLNTDAEPEELRDFLASLASYVLACDVTLQDGETIGFSADDKHTITRSPGISLPEEQMTLKIGYEPIKGDPEDDSCDHSDNDDTQDEEEFSNPEVYTEEEMEAVEGHIEQYFGKVENVFHELVSPDIHVDICIVPPTEERDYYTLVTMGMGAHRMNVPEELAEYKLERAELAIALPADWKLVQESMQDERWYWPIRLLKVLARLPIASDTWLGFGHTMDNKENFAENTKLCAAILTGPQSTEEGGEVCTLPGGEEVNFYQVIPLYEDELDYKLEHDVDALLNKMRGISFVVNPTRQNAITRGTLSNDDFDGEMDDASYHLESIEEKELPIDPINAYNHMAIYLRWCMEHDLMGEDFLKEYSEVTKQVKADPANVDLREFIRDELDGCLFSVLFNQQGRAFAGYYYGEGDSPYYPADIDDYALKYFGPSRYHSNEFQQEAYLFIPFDEKYYQTMAQVIEERFENWQGQDFDEDTLEPSEVAQAIMEYLDCECTYFPSMADDDPIMSAYSYAQRLGVREGFVPVLIQADDETLLECLVMNADPEHDADCYEFDLKTVEEYRKKMLSAPIKDGKAILEELTGQRKEEAEDDDLDWEEEVLGEMEGGEPNDRFANYWNDDTGMTYPLILAKIPVKNPWEIFAYLPFGNWNECPDTPDLMAVAKYWFEQHGAIPAAMSHDELEFELPTPISKERAMEVAVEQYGFCPDLDQNEDGSIGSLADVLWQSTVWYFWWD